MMTPHSISRDHAGKAEMSSITPTCSCGWRGTPEYAYNDYQHVAVTEQERKHFQAVREAPKA